MKALNVSKACAVALDRSASYRELSKHMGGLKDGREAARIADAYMKAAITLASLHLDLDQLNRDEKEL